jgi:hypothetical protein
MAPRFTSLATATAVGLTAVPALAQDGPLPTQSYSDWTTSVGINTLNNQTVRRVAADNARSKVAPQARSHARSRADAQIADCRSRVGTPTTREEYERYKACLGM